MTRPGLPAGGATRRQDGPGPSRTAPRVDAEAAPGYGGCMAKPASLPDVVLVTKADCHLCAEARAAVGRVTAALGIDWSEQSVDDDAGLRERFAEEIPVVLVNGVQRDFWKIDEARLTRTLQRLLSQPS
jgi:Glutaredoxin-like domain (DUF836)